MAFQFSDLGAEILASGKTQRIVEVSSTETIIGIAEPGTPTSSPNWLIKQILVTGSTTAILFAEGTNIGKLIFDDYASYSYF